MKVQSSVKAGKKETTKTETQTVGVQSVAAEKAPATGTLEKLDLGRVVFFIIGL